jgi:cobalt/nickel transport system permease protein
MIRLIDAYSHHNRLKPFSPIWKSGFAAVLFLISYLASPLIQAAAFIWISMWIVWHAGIPARFYLKLLGGPGLFFIASLPAIIIGFQKTAAGSAGPEGRTLFTASHWTAYVIRDWAWISGTLGLRIAACTACLFFLILTTPVPQLFQVAKRLRIPGLVLELMNIMYRFLFLLLDTSSDIYTSQQARGGYRGFRNKLADTAMLTGRLFAKTMQRYKGVSHGLMARGFTEEIRLAPYQAAGVPLRFALEGLAGIGILIGATLWLKGGIL